MDLTNVDDKYLPEGHDLWNAYTWVYLNFLFNNKKLSIKSLNRLNFGDLLLNVDSTKQTRFRPEKSDTTMEHIVLFMELPFV